MNVSAVSSMSTDRRQRTPNHHVWPANVAWHVKTVSWWLVAEAEILSLSNRLRRKQRDHLSRKPDGCQGTVAYIKSGATSESSRLLWALSPILNDFFALCVVDSVLIATIKYTCLKLRRGSSVAKIKFAVPEWWSPWWKSIGSQLTLKNACSTMWWVP